ncbi:hypothetical protein G6011_04090 [Alternaria panax]|uniref:Heterokaryon incompatibility domain-containing protein n=1 Tax=Alternaria panax TaxID=48097 RepID=A0AAD4IG76_9PLEO|nr:hypothetical protein G6011_04090 [Alternaria panax]
MTDSYLASSVKLEAAQKLDSTLTVSSFAYTVWRSPLGSNVSYPGFIEYLEISPLASIIDYEYRALENTQGAIRTFVLHPAEQLDAPISGELQYVSHESYKYTAVSYVWGNPSNVHSIQISGCAFGIADNLFNVLRSLRDQADPISLWIDAICIDQNNIPERNAQVQKMASIYRSAFEVVGWLGHTLPDFDVGFSLLKTLIEEDSQPYLEDTSYTPAWESLISLLNKPYWTRVWILQETAINPNVLLKFGTNSSKQQIAVSFLSEWDNIRFEVVSKWRELHPDAEWEGSMMQKFDGISNDVYNMGHLPRLVPLTADEFQPLLQSQICNGPLASNPLDYVYGIIGLFDTPILSVDYSVSPRELFLKVIETIQHRTGKLDFLSWAWGNYAQDASVFSNQHNIPRWGIDFSYRTRFVRPVPFANSSQSQRLIWDTFYNAAGEIKQKVEFSLSKENVTFRARGICVTKIDLVGSLANFDQSDTIWPEDWIGIGGFNDIRAPLKQRNVRSEQHDLECWATTSGATDPASLDVWWRTVFGDTLSREAQ